MKLTITGSGRLGAIAREVEVLAHAAPREMATVLNSVGPAARGLVIAAETKQTGLKRATIVRALKERRASTGTRCQPPSQPMSNASCETAATFRAACGEVALMPWLHFSGIATSLPSSRTRPW